MEQINNKLVWVRVDLRSNGFGDVWTKDHKIIKETKFTFKINHWGAGVKKIDVGNFRIKHINTDNQLFPYCNWNGYFFEHQVQEAIKSAKTEIHLEVNLLKKRVDELFQGLLIEINK